MTEALFIARGKNTREKFMMNNRSQTFEGKYSTF